MSTTIINYPHPPDSYTIETASRETIAAIQNQGFQRLLNSAWHKVPFYRRRWQAEGIDISRIRDMEDIQKLPIISKEDLEQSLRDFPPFGDYQGDYPCYRIQASSGSTGFPKPIFHTARDWDIITNFWARRLAAQGVLQGDLVQIAFTYAPFIVGFTSTEGALKLGATIIPAGSGAVTPSERQVEIAHRWGTTVIGTTGAYALRLAEVAEEMGYDLKKDFKIKAMFHTAESLTEEMRDRIEGKWGCKSYNNYGSVETGAPAWECREQNGMHINEDGYFFEVVDPVSKQSLPDGKEGALVITSLFKEAAPVIRYMIGDIATIVNTPCKCGCTFRRIIKIAGRTDEMLKVKGITVYPTAVEGALHRLPEIGNEYRIVIDKVNDQDHIILQVETDLLGEKQKELHQKIKHSLKTQVGIQVPVEFFSPGELQKELNVDQRIKSRRILDRRKNSGG
ncbi:MAG: AMP-binding protein [Bacillota bacterium]|nr:AMP-binding protein [Bacillota bacterium]